MSAGRSRFSTVAFSATTAAVALAIAVGSVASASISTCGCSPRSTRREKSGGMFSTNITSPRASACSASSSLAIGWMSKYPVFCNAAASVRS